MFEIIIGKLGKLFLKENSASPVGVSGIASPPPCLAMAGTLPVLSARELLSARRGQVNRIEELASTTRPHFEQYYLGMLWRYAEWSQQLPTSEVHHHAYPGGLLDHGLGAAIAALRTRQGRLLPPGAPPEEAVLKKALWTYAIFTLALLHDAANPAMGLAVTVFAEDQSAWAWNPWAGAIGANANARCYRFGFNRQEVIDTQPSAGLMLAPYLVGCEGLAWLQSDPMLFGLWLACASGGAAQAGVLGEIVNKAVSESVGRCLGSGQPMADNGVDAPFSLSEAPPGAREAAPVPVAPGLEQRRDEGGCNGAGGGDGQIPDRGASANFAAIAKAMPATTPKGHSAGEGKGEMPVKSVGRDFLNWLVAGIQSGLIQYNRPEARIHVVQEGVLLASPMIFKDYAGQIGEDDFKPIQKSFYKLKLHQENSAGLNAYQYVFSGSNSVITGVLLANPGIVFGADAPEPNPLLKRR